MGDRRRTAAVRRAARAVVEGLERRALLSAYPDPDFPELWIVAADTDDGDRIHVEPVPGRAGVVRAFINGKLAGETKVKGLEGIDVYGGLGDDRITLGEGIGAPVYVSGFGGDDTIIGADGAELLSGDGGNDVISGGSGDDFLHGLAGNDRLDGGVGTDRLDGSDGDDTLDGTVGGDEMWGGIGRDVVKGGPDRWYEYEDGWWYIEGDQDPDRPDDRIVIETDPAKPSNVRAVVNGRVIGSVPAKRLEDVYVYAGDGDDVVTFALGRSGKHVIADANGGRGDDRITGGREDNDFSGEEGDDTLDGGAGGDDYLYGDAGDDVVTPVDEDLNERGGNAYADLDQGWWWVQLNGNSSHGVDAVLRLDPDDPLTLQLLMGVKVEASVSLDDVKEIELEGTDFDDLITIDLPAKLGIPILVSGMAGDDTLVGSDGGGETLSGDQGDDVLRGRGGDDQLEGHAGDDKLEGGGGADTIFGGGHGDSIFGGGGEDVIKAGSGEDDLHGGKGDDTLDGGGGGDNLSGDGGDDTLNGGAGTDTVSGGAGEDWVPGVCGLGDVMLDDDDDSEGGAEAKVEALMRGKKLRADDVLDAGFGKSPLS